MRNRNRAGVLRLRYRLLRAYDFNMETHALQAPGAEPENTSPGRVAAPLRVTVAGHELTIFVESMPMIAAMVRDIQCAQKRVWLESYIFLNDVAGCAVAAAVQERARAGLDVRVL